MMAAYKGWIIHELESWAETFNNHYPDHTEEVIAEENEAYDYIHFLIDKFTKNECSKEDYENILFHIWQSKHEP